VLDVPDNGRLGVSADLARAQRQAARALAGMGARVDEERVPGLRRSLEIWSAMLGTAEAVSFRERMGDGAPFAPGRELARWALGRSKHTLPGIVLAAIEGVTKLSEAQTRKLVDEGVALKREIVETLGERGVMLFPSYPTVAPRHGAALVPPIKWMYTAIFNVLELPVTQVPLGLDARGLPLGVQVVGVPGNDHVTIAVAMALERALGGWVMPRA
jgi:fatty acid amide hydrolase 2